MPVQKRSKGSSKSKKTIRRRTMRGGGDISDKMIEYLKSKGITEEAGYDFTTLDDEKAKEMFNVDENDYQNWLSLQSHDVKINEDGEPEEVDRAASGVAAAEEASGVADGAAANGVAADGVAYGEPPADEAAADGEAPIAAAPTTAPVVFDSNKLLTDINSAIEKTVKNAISGGKKYKIKGGVKLNIVAYQYKGNNINILSSETKEFQTIIRLSLIHI